MPISNLPAELLIQIVDYVLESDVAGEPLRELVEGQAVANNTQLRRLIPAVTLVNRQFRAASIAALKSKYVTGNGPSNCTLDSVLLSERHLVHSWAAIPPRARIVTRSIGSQDSKFDIDTLTWVIRPWERISWADRKYSIFYSGDLTWKILFMFAFQRVLSNGPYFWEPSYHDGLGFEWSIRNLELHFQTPTGVQESDLRDLPRAGWEGLGDGHPGELEEAKMIAPITLARAVKSQLLAMSRPEQLVSHGSEYLFNNIGKVTIILDGKEEGVVDFTRLLKRSFEDAFPSLDRSDPSTARLRRAYQEWRPRVALRRMRLGLEEPYRSMKSEIDAKYHYDHRWGFGDIMSHIPMDDMDAIRDWKLVDHRLEVKRCSETRKSGGVSPCSLPTVKAAGWDLASLGIALCLGLVPLSLIVWFNWDLIQDIRPIHTWRLKLAESD